MITGFFDLFRNFKSAVITSAVIVVVIATLTFVGSLLWDKHSLTKELTDSKAKVESLSQDLFQQKIKVHGLEVAVDVLEKTYEKLGEYQKIEAETDKEIDNAKPEDDGEVAPVLRDAIGRVDRMLHLHKDGN